MSGDNIRKRKTKNGDTCYQITIELGKDPETGERKRMYRNVRGTKTEAKAEKQRLQNEIAQGKILDESSKKVGDWMDEWLEMYLPNIAETTRIGYKAKIKDYIKPSIGNIMLKSLKPEHVQRMVNDMTSRNLSPKSIRDTYNNINAAMKKAVRLRMVNNNPCEGVELPKLKKYRATVYDASMLQTLLHVANGTDMYIPVLLLATVGLRRGELLALRWEDINFEKQILSVRHNMVRGETGFIIKSPKSESGIRDIHIGKEVIRDLAEAKRQYNLDKLRLGPLFQDLGFVVRQEDGSPIMPDSMTQKWTRFITKNNLEKIRLHDLRHSNATALIRAGVSPKVVQERLGHADISITLNTYTHVLPDMDVAAADKLDDILLREA